MPIRFEFSEQIERKLLRQLDFALVRSYTKAAQVAQQPVTHRAIPSTKP